MIKYEEAQMVHKYFYKAFSILYINNVTALFSAPLSATFPHTPAAATEVCHNNSAGSHYMSSMRIKIYEMLSRLKRRKCVQI